MQHANANAGYMQLYAEIMRRVINKNTKTGDTFNPLFAIVALTAALLAALLAVLSYFRDRKDGEEA